MDRSNRKTLTPPSNEVTHEAVDVRPAHLLDAKVALMAGNQVFLAAVTVSELRYSPLVITRRGLLLEQISTPPTPGLLRQPFNRAPAP